jgi:hypothetical protein
MKFKAALCAVAALMLFACGLDGANYKFESGSYGVSEAKLVSSTDGCGFFPVYASGDKVIGVSVSDTTVTFNLTNDPTAPAVWKPTATLDSNVLSTLAKADYEVEYFDTAGDTICVARVNSEVTGDVTADNTGLLTLAMNVTEFSGSCAGITLDFAAIPCASTYEFTATKK